IIRDCRTAVELIEPSLNEKVLPFEYDADLRFEAPMEIPHPAGHQETILLIGAMDILVRKAPDEWPVYDVKHTKDNSYWKKTRGQLSFYDLVTDVLFGAPTVEVGLFQPLCTHREKLFRLEESDRTVLLTQVHKMAEDIWKENFDPTAPI